MDGAPRYVYLEAGDEEGTWRGYRLRESVALARPLPLLLGDLATYRAARLDGCAPTPATTKPASPQAHTHTHTLASTHSQPIEGAHQGECLADKRRCRCRCRWVPRRGGC
jgi:hypothetical protein